MTRHQTALTTALPRKRRGLAAAKATMAATTTTTAAATTQTDPPVLVRIDDAYYFGRVYTTHADGSCDVMFPDDGDCRLVKPEDIAHGSARAAEVAALPLARTLRALAADVRGLKRRAEESDEAFAAAADAMAPSAGAPNSGSDLPDAGDSAATVSYTHLTLPTICSV